MPATIVPYGRRCEIGAGRFSPSIALAVWCRGTVPRRLETSAQIEYQLDPYTNQSAEEAIVEKIAIERLKCTDGVPDDA